MPMSGYPRVDETGGCVGSAQGSVTSTLCLFSSSITLVCEASYTIARARRSWRGWTKRGRSPRWCLDGAGVPRDAGQVVGRLVVKLLQIEHDLVREFLARAAAFRRQ